MGWWWMENGELEYRWVENGKQRVGTQGRIVHIRGFGGSPLGGLSTLSFCRQAFGMAKAIDRAASATFRNGVRPSGILSTKDRLTAEPRGVSEYLLQGNSDSSLPAGRPMGSEERLVGRKVVRQWRCWWVQ